MKLRKTQQDDLLMYLNGQYRIIKVRTITNETLRVLAEEIIDRLNRGEKSAGREVYREEDWYDELQIDEAGKETPLLPMEAINLVVGRDIDNIIPKGMSHSVGKFIRVLEDYLPNEILYSDRWKAAVVRAVETDVYYEKEKTKVLSSWTWEKIFPSLFTFSQCLHVEPQWEDMMSKQTFASIEVFQKSFIHAASLGTGSFDKDKAFLVSLCIGNAYDGFRVPNGASYFITSAVYLVKALSFESIDQKSDLNAWNNLDPCEILERMFIASPGNPIPLWVGRDRCAGQGVQCPADSQ